MELIKRLTQRHRERESRCSLIKIQTHKREEIRKFFLCLLVFLVAIKWKNRGSRGCRRYPISKLPRGCVAGAVIGMQTWMKFDFVWCVQRTERKHSPRWKKLNRAAARRKLKRVPPLARHTVCRSHKRQDHIGVLPGEDLPSWGHWYLHKFDHSLN